MTFGLQCTKESLRRFGAGVERLIKGGDLCREESRDMFAEVLQDLQPDIAQGAFLAAMSAKGATPEELAGAWEAIFEIDTTKAHPNVSGPLAENCGTGMDSIKTFNISTAAALVAATDGLPVARHGSRAITSRCGTVDLLEVLGIDVDCEVDVVKRSIERAGIGMFNGMSGKVHPKSLYRILSQIRFGTVLNIAASLANPAMPKYGVRGVYCPEMVTPVARTMKEIGYKRAMVVHGMDDGGERGMDEISTLGKTLVALLELDGEIIEYEISASYLGIAKAQERELLYSGETESEAIELIRLLSGNGSAARADIAAINAAALLFVAGSASSLESGFAKAQDIIESGRAINVLSSWIDEQGRREDGRARFEQLLSAA
jgi:anthranilate phosphoribosyltransferase